MSFRQQRQIRDRRQLPRQAFIANPLVYLRYVEHGATTLTVQLTPNDLGWIDYAPLPLPLDRGGPILPVSQTRTDSLVILDYAVPLIAGDTFTLVQSSSAISDRYGAVVVPGTVTIPAATVTIPQFDWHVLRLNGTFLYVQALDDSQTLYGRDPSLWVTVPTGIQGVALSSTYGVSGMQVSFAADESGETGLTFNGTLWQCWADSGNLIIPGTRPIV